jgi:DNA-binding NarL/FixJ family response regulator
MTAMMTTGATAHSFEPEAAPAARSRAGGGLASVADLAAFRAAERPSLSAREVEVMLGWLAADSKEEAAARLYISASTVSTHVARIRATWVPAPTKAHLLARALQDGYTTLAEW